MSCISTDDKITRAWVQDEPHSFFIFADNMLRQGHEGQSTEMRGEANTIGIAIKWTPGTADDDYFAPGDEHDLRVRTRMLSDFKRIELILEAGGTVIFNRASLGAEMLHALKERAPFILERIGSFLTRMLKTFPAE
jgi:hypothetical protein